MGQGQAQARGRSTLHPLPQVPYRSMRHQAAPGVIEFVVDGERGIRLSDVLEGNWVGLEGRDDRSLFEGTRLQIILRLHVRRPLKVLYHHLTVSSSSLDVHPGSQR